MMTFYFHSFLLLFQLKDILYDDIITTIFYFMIHTGYIDNYGCIDISNLYIDPTRIDSK
jgi:hypothetical protein